MSRRQPAPVAGHRDGFSEACREAIRRLLSFCSRPTAPPDRPGRSLAGQAPARTRDRPDDAMRLWMSWLRPVIVQNETAFSCALRPPGLLHAIDAAALWSALLPRLPVDLLTAPSPDEGAPSSEERADALRRRSLAVLSAATRSPRHQTDLLADINGARGALMKGAGVPPFTGDDLRMCIAMLRTAPVWRVLRGSPGHLASGDLLAFLAEALAARRAEPDDVLLVGLAHLHERQDPRFAEALHELHPSALVETAALAHLDMAAHRLRHAIDHRLLGLRMETVSEPARDPFGLLDQVLDWYDRLRALSFFSDPNLADEAESLILGLGNAVERDLDPALLRQLERATIRSVPMRTVLGLRFSLTFDAELSKRGRGHVRTAWREQVGAQLARLFDAALDDPAMTLDALADMADLADAVGHPIPISVLDTRLIASVRDALLRRDPVSGAKRRLIERTVDAGVMERRRLKWWMSDDVRSLIEAAAQFRSFNTFGNLGR